MCEFIGVGNEVFFNFCPSNILYPNYKSLKFTWVNQEMCYEYILQEGVDGASHIFSGHKYIVIAHDENVDTDTAIRRMLHVGLSNSGLGIRQRLKHFDIGRFTECVLEHMPPEAGMALCRVLIV